ncbi:MAG TPA: NAD(P)/FAD-dependent oxidoreductase [Caulobacteraceae bacterium]|nr:NAD(P)/FAD-dependent oxidoreductase [Caulobacteraceae bacterium]
MIGPLNAQPSSNDRVIVVGGGIAGSLLALVLGRAGCAVSLIDLKREPSPDFRNEKLGIDQIQRLDDLGVLPCFEQAVWGDDPGALAALTLPPLKDCGARYDQWVSRLRAALPPTVQFVEGKVDQIDTSDDRQSVTLSDGSHIDGRLVVLATGRGERLRAGLGIRRQTISEKHSLCLGFSVKPRDGEPLSFQAQVLLGRSGDRIAYATIFPMREEIRVNVFSYRDIADPWVAELRRDPVGALGRALPEAAAALDGMDVVRDLEVRSTDIYGVGGHIRPGVVLLGDAFHAPCPSSGTGMTRILNDVALLAQVYLPQWLATPGMDAAKIARFYADPIKRRVDQMSLHRSLRGRDVVVSQSPYWRARRALGLLKRRLAPDGIRIKVARNINQAASPIQ